MEVQLEICPESLALGRGSVLFVKGYCSSSVSGVRSVTLKFAEQYQQAAIRDIDSSDGKRTLFWAFIELEPRIESLSLPMAARIELSDGSSEVLELVRVRQSAALEAQTVTIPEPPQGRGSQPLIAICMATYNPPPELFGRQVESIRRQTHSKWFCLVRDDGSDAQSFLAITKIVGEDARFRIVRGEARLGFYQNFEACLALVPQNVDYVALADQDDYWHPDKLEALVGACSEGTSLVYSDMKLVDRYGRVLADTFWEGKTNNFSDLSSLLMANTITGAASLFPRQLLDLVLPFPPSVGPSFHDHWIACVALARGKIRYLDRPLYDWTQHDANSVGRFRPPRVPFRLGSPTLRFVVRALRDSGFRESVMRDWQGAYFTEVVRAQIYARVLLSRIPSIEGSRRRALRRVRGLHGSIAELSWLALRGLVFLWKMPAARGMEYTFLRGLLWLRLSHLRLSSALRRQTQSTNS